MRMLKEKTELKKQRKENDDTKANKKISEDILGSILDKMTFKIPRINKTGVNNTQKALETVKRFKEKKS